MNKPELSKQEKLLLLELEDIVGKAFYNANIRNYEGRDNYTEGRSFRYPVTTYVKRDEKWEKSRVCFTTDDPAEQILDAVYSLGANELSIFRALYRILRFLKSEKKLTIQGFENADV